MFIQCILIIVSSALVAADSRLSQRITDTGSTDMLQCYVRYLCESNQQEVLVLHKNYKDVSQYIACIRSPITVVNITQLQLVDSPKVERLYDLVVLVLATLKDIKSYFYLLFNMSHRSRGGRFLVVYLGNEQRIKYIFETVRSLHLINTVVLQMRDAHVYTYFPYGNGWCDTLVRMEVLGHCQQLSLHELYPVKIPKQFNGCALRMPSIVAPPAVIDPWAKTDQPLVAGYEGALTNIIFKHLNFTKNILSLPPLFVKRCSYAYPYYTDTLVWVAPAPMPGAQWKSLVLVFQAVLWYSALAFFLFNTLVWWLLGRANSVAAGGAAASYVECVLGSLLVLLNGAVPFPKSTAMRFLVASWTLCALVLVAAYQSQFLSMLLAPVYEKQIANEQEMLESDLPIELPGNQVLEYLASTSPLKIEILRRAQSLHTPRDPAKGHMFLQYSLTTKFLAKNYTDSLGKSTVYLFKEPVLYQPRCLSFNKGHPVVDLSNKLLRQLVESGIVAKFMREMDFTSYGNLYESENIPITLHHLECAFFALLIGYTVAMVTFLLEQIVMSATQK